MGRILFWLLIGLGAYFVWRWWGIQQRLGDRRRQASDARREAGERMVRCEVCGLNVPQSEAIAGSGRWYCSDEHRRRASD